MRNLENQIRQLATVLCNKPQGSLPSNTEDLRREGKEHCKVINFRSIKDVNTPVGVPKRRMKSDEGQEDTQIEVESQSFTFQNVNQHISATTSVENYNPAPATLVQNMAKEK